LRSHYCALTDVHVPSAVKYAGYSPGTATTNAGTDAIEDLHRNEAPGVDDMAGDQGADR
jgi:hypothetical protein